MAETKTTRHGNTFKDITGQQFYRWTVLYFFDRVGTATRWMCRCECGRELVRIGQSLKNGDSKSCGCYRDELQTKHGKQKEREYLKWHAARSRCTNPRNTKWRIYGARGITMCDRWLQSFDNFFEDMGKCPPGLTLDRKDNDGPYSPDNCRWATRAEQTRNRRNTLMATHDGETLSLGEWAERTGIPYDRLEDRYEHGTPLFIPSHQGKKIS